MFKKIFRLITLFFKIGFRIHLMYSAKKYFKERSHSTRKPRLMFGNDPLISNKYWSKAMIDVGYESKSVMPDYYSINQKEDYDMYFNDILEQSKFKLKYFYGEYIVLNYILKNFDIVHIPFNGFSLYDKWIKKNEIELLKKFGCKIIVLPYGGDFWQYSKVTDISWRHVLQANYPLASFKEEKISKNIKKLTQAAEIIMAGFQTDGLGRWDVFPYNFVTMDLNKCTFNPNKYFNNDGINGVVKVVHTPNHRYIKGTEYLIDAINQLKAEGLNVELILIEKKSNDEVLKILGSEADILMEQLVLGYGISAMEGMGCGLPVITNFDNENYTRAFRRYSYLNECPMISSTPESIKEDLRILIKNPALRKDIGIASRNYAEKYHSNKTAQYIFSKIYDKIWFNKDVDLMNMFHPLNPDSYNNQSPKIEHPLFENKIPEALLNTLNK